jgi:hypothetical protein
MGIALLVALGSVGQFGYAGPFQGGFGRPGFGYFGYPLSLPYYDPIGYYRYYNGAGYYRLAPTPVFPPKVITIRPWLMERPGLTGRVVGLDERARTITLRLPAETVLVRYGSETRWRAVDDSFPEIRPGALINVDHGTITVLRQGEG